MRSYLSDHDRIADVVQNSHRSVEKALDALEAAHEVLGGAHEMWRAGADVRRRVLGDPAEGGPVLRDDELRSLDDQHTAGGRDRARATPTLTNASLSMEDHQGRRDAGVQQLSHKAGR